MNTDYSALVKEAREKVDSVMERPWQTSDWDFSVFCRTAVPRLCDAVEELQQPASDWIGLVEAIQGLCDLLKAEVERLHECLRLESEAHIAERGKLRAENKRLKGS